MTYQNNSSREYDDSHDDSWDSRRDPYIGEGYEGDGDAHYQYESQEVDYDPYLHDDNPRPHESVDSYWNRNGSNDDTIGYREDPQINEYNSDRPQAGIRISDRDLIDVSRDNTRPRVGKALFNMGAVVVVFGTVVMILLSMRPDVTAYEIVSMEDYAGEQRPDWAIDPQEIDGCKSAAACIKEKLSFFSRGSVEKEDTSQLKEIPASTADLILDNSLVVSTVSDPQTMTVLEQWSNIRAEPVITGEIITAIASGKQVEILGQSGVWYEVITLDGKGVSGYMHRSTLR